MTRLAVRTARGWAVLTLALVVVVAGAAYARARGRPPRIANDPVLLVATVIAEYQTTPELQRYRLSRAQAAALRPLVLAMRDASDRPERVRAALEVSRALDALLRPDQAEAMRATLYTVQRTMRRYRIGDPRLEPARAEALARALAELAD